MSGALQRSVGLRDTAFRDLRDRYAAALHAYLEDSGESALQCAYELGRRAIDDGLGILDLITLHREATHRIMQDRRDAKGRGSTLEASEEFLGESLAPFEMTHRGFQEAIVALRSLNQRLEEEARRIAHALHDDAGQLLVSVHLALQDAAAGLPARARGRLERVRVPLDEIEKHLRQLSHELRPTILDDLGLLPALEFLAQGVTMRSGIPIQVEGPRRPRLPSAVETALYRVVQEALRNAARHSRARNVRIHVQIEPGVVRCSVKDDGRGFDVAAALERKGDRGLGLIGMRERLNALGGQIAIDSAPARGTELRIMIPEEGLNADPGTAG